MDATTARRRTRPMPVDQASKAGAARPGPVPRAAPPLPVEVATAAPATMRAVAHDRYGPASSLQLRDVAVPAPGPDEVLVEVHAAGVDRGVAHLVTGRPWLVRLAGYGLRRPRQPVAGTDVAGRVVAVGSATTRFRLGAMVFGLASGAYAGYATAREATLAPLPPGVGVEAAAATPTSGLAALQALRDVGRVAPGQRVLVVGASGGVGAFAVQLGRHLGARVTGVASAAKLDLVRSLGAEAVVDYTAEDALDGSVRYDLVIDVGGRSSLRRLRRALVPWGTLVIAGGEHPNPVTGGAGRQLRALALSPFVPQRLTAFVSRQRGADIAELGRLLATGAIVAPVDRTYRLDAAPEALADLEAGRVRGKSVIRIAPRPHPAPGA